VEHPTREVFIPVSESGPAEPAGYCRARRARSGVDPVKEGTERRWPP